MRFISSSSVVTAKAAPRRFARSVAIVLSLFAMLTLAVASAPVASAAAAPKGIDLIVTAVGPSTSATGANVVPTATVKNQGTVKTPAGKILDVAFFIEGETVWSDTKTTSLAPGASVTLTANGGENGRNYWVATAGAHTVTATVNSVNRITETSTTNNKLAGTITGSTPMSDLVVTSVSPTSAALGGKVVPSATVKNQGTLATPAGTILDVAFFVDGTTVWSDTKTTSLAPGASVTLTANGGDNGNSWTATAGTHQLRAQVNSVNRISESSMTNNELTGTITTTVPATTTTTTVPPTTTTTTTAPPVTKSDLIVTAVSPSSTAMGANVVPSATVKNQGTAATPAGTILDVAFFIDGTTVWSDTNTTSLAPGASVTLTANGGDNGNSWTATAGTHQLRAQVNSVNRISESNMTNNELTGTITTTVPATTTTTTVPPTTTTTTTAPPVTKSDLIVTAVTPASTATGNRVVPSATVKNQGTVATPAGTILDVAFFVDGTTVWSDTNTTSLAPGASVTLTANGGDNGNSWTATSGSHALKATVNSVNRIAETDTTNNTLTKTINNTTPTPTTTTPPPTTTTTPPNPGARQPVLAWLGVVDMDNLLGNRAGGITFDTLSDHSIDGSVISIGHLEASVPSWMVSEFTAVKSHGQLYVGANIADPLPANSSEWATFQERWVTLANAAKAAGANGMSMDAEPYGFDDEHWQGSDHQGMYNQARALAPTIKSVGKLIVYPSSNASFPGSYNDLIVAQAGRPDFYANSRFPDFLRGLIDGGVDVTLVDASFHFGVQYSGDQGDWSTGVAHSARLTHQVFPSLRASVMIWPDNSERNGGGSAGYFSAGSVQNMIQEGLPEVDGPFIVYQHNMATGTIAGTWNTYLDAIDTAVRNLG